MGEYGPDMPDQEKIE